MPATISMRTVNESIRRARLMDGKARLHPSAMKTLADLRREREARRVA